MNLKLHDFVFVLRRKIEKIRTGENQAYLYMCRKYSELFER